MQEKDGGREGGKNKTKNGSKKEYWQIKCKVYGEGGGLTFINWRVNMSWRRSSPHLNIIFTSGPSGIMFWKRNQRGF